MTRGFIKSKKLYGHRNTRSGIVQQLEIIQHKDRPSRLYSFSSEFVAKRPKSQKDAGCSIQYISRSPNSDYRLRRVKGPPELRFSVPDCSAFRPLQSNSVVTSNQHPLFSTPRDPRWFFNFPKLSYSCIIFKNSSSLKIRTPISCALSSFDPASSPANT